MGAAGAVVKELLLAAMMMASRLSGLPEAAELPTMVFLPQDQMCVAVEACDQARSGDVIVAAHYDMDTRRLTLPVEWSPADPQDMSSLIHEMVHHLQAEKWPEEADRPCDGHIEKQAYDAEDKFLGSMGLSLDIGLRYRMMVTHCDD